jgi:hypothetical protein
MAKASTGGIIGQSFDPFVQQQIKTRQEILGKNPRSDNDNKWYNTSAPWIRLTSGIDVSDEKLQELDLLFTPFQGSGLAKEFQLFGGNNTTTSVKRIYNSDYWDGYEFQNQAEYGAVPTPGILSADIKSLSRGSLREATISIVCHSLIQFKIIETLYLRLKYSILLEWGHSTYYKNDGEYEGNPKIDLSADFLTGYYSTNGGNVKLTQGTMQSRIRDLRKESCGNYDAFHGLVKNFTWSVRQDGGYDITLILITTGDVIESIKMNTLPNTSTVVAAVPTGSDDKTYPSTYTNQNRSTINKMLFGLRQQINASRTYFNGYGTDNNLCNTEDLAWVGALGGGVVKWLYHKDNKTASGPNAYGTYYEFQACTLPYMLPDNYYYVDDQYYIKLGTLLKIMESYLLFYNTDTDVSSISATDIDGNEPEIGYGNPPIINIDYDFETNLCLTTDRHVSVDPRVCILPINVSTTAATSSYVEYKWDGEYDYEFSIEVIRSGAKNISLFINMGGATSTSTISTIPPFMPTAYNGTSGGSTYFGVDDYTGGPPQVPARGFTPHATRLNTRYLVSFSPTTPQTVTSIYANAGGSKAIYKGKANIQVIEYRNAAARFGVPPATPPPLGYGKIYTDLFDGDHGFRTSNFFIGKTMHIPINIEFIAQTLADNTDSKENKIALYDFLRSILDGIQEATGNINNFEIIYDETINSLKIIDNTIIPGGLEYLGITQNIITPINPNLLRQNYGSFARNVSLKTEFSNAFATMVTVGAQANGNVAGENSTAFSKWNGGLTDRIIPRKITAPTTTGPTVETVYYNQVSALQDFNASVDERVVTEAQIEAIKGTLSDILKYELGGYTNSNSYPQVENGLGFIPLNMSITMEGLSGPKIYEVYTIDETLLPKNYKDKIQFITKGVSHKIDTSGWFTILESIGGPRNEDLAVGSPPPVKKLGVVRSGGGGGGGGGCTAVGLNKPITAVSQTNPLFYNIENGGKDVDTAFKLRAHHCEKGANWIDDPANIRSGGWTRTSGTYTGGVPAYVYDLVLSREEGGRITERPWVPSPVDGKITALNASGPDSNIAIKDGNGNIHRLLHGDNFQVSVGNTVTRGQKLFRQSDVMDDSEYARNIHLHVEFTDRSVLENYIADLFNGTLNPPA